MTNIDLFDHYAALVLGELYENFPVARDLDTRKLTGHADTDEYGAICGPDGRPSKQVEIAYHTISWLVDAGYVRCRDQRPLYGFSGCVLTAEGLRLLKATPESVRVKETIGAKLARLVREGSIDLAKDIIRSIAWTG